MARPRFRLLGHTADVRVAIWGADEFELLDNLVRATTRVVMGWPLELAPTLCAPLEHWPETLEARLVLVANEVVFQLLHRRRAGTGLTRAADAPALELAELPPDARPELEVKAATYHDLRPRWRRGRLAAVVTMDL